MHRVTIIQRALVCDTCDETIGILDGSDDGRTIRWNLTYAADPDDDFHTCHRTPTPRQLQVAVRYQAGLPGTHWTDDSQHGDWDIPF